MDISLDIGLGYLIENSITANVLQLHKAIISKSCCLCQSYVPSW